MPDQPSSTQVTSTSTSTTTSTAALDAIQPRRVPTQRRSRERMERILAVARELIEAQGSDALRMNEVAERAGISIGSLYQYFPDKAAVIYALADRYSAEGRNCVDSACAEVFGPRDLAVAVTTMVSGYYAMFMAEPVMRDIWSGLQADPTLRAMSAVESAVLAEKLLATLVRIYPQADRAAMEVTARLMMELTEATMRLAISVPREMGDALVERFQAIFIRELTAFGTS